MNNTRLVSIITATYNMGNYLSEAIESVQRQTYVNFEHLIIDDGSTDKTREIITKYSNDKRIKYYFQENKGQAAAKNMGLKKSKGDYITFLDADNLWYKNKIKNQIAIMNNFKTGIGVLHADIQMIDHEGNEINTPVIAKPNGKVSFELLLENFVGFNTVMIPRNVIEDIGLFDESLTMGIDYDLWLRISVKHEFLHFPEKLVLYRIWDGQMSKNMIERLNCVDSIMKKFISMNPGLHTKKKLNIVWAKHHTTRARYFLEIGDKRNALNNLIIAAKFCPKYFVIWKSFGKLIFS